MSGIYSTPDTEQPELDGADQPDPIEVSAPSIKPKPKRKGRRMVPAEEAEQKRRFTPEQKLLVVVHLWPSMIRGRTFSESQSAARLLGERPMVKIM